STSQPSTDPSLQQSNTPILRCFGTAWYGLVHLESAKTPMFIGLGTGGTPWIPLGYPPHLLSSPSRLAPCLASDRDPTTTVLARELNRWGIQIVTDLGQDSCQRTVKTWGSKLLARLGSQIRG